MFISNKYILFLMSIRYRNREVTKMELLKTIWNVAVLLFSVSCFGAFAGITYKLGMSALDLHQRGLVSLSKYDRMLVGEESLSSSHYSKKQESGQSASKRMKTD